MIGRLLSVFSMAVACAGVISCAEPGSIEEDFGDSMSPVSLPINPTKSFASFPSFPTLELPKLDVPPIRLPPLPSLPNFPGLAEEAWGEAGRYAYSAAANIMRLRNANRPEEALPRHDRAVLRKYYGDLVNHVSVFWGADPLNEWSFGPHTIFLGGVESSAQTYGQYIYVRYAQEDMSVRDRLALLAHELVHVQQFERFGSSLSEFGYQYFREYKRADQNYENNKLEREAFEKVNAAFVDALVNDYREKVTPPSLCLVGVEGTLTFRNPTSARVSYQFRWSEGDAWSSYLLEAQTWRTHAVDNGCGEVNRAPQIRFDYSFSDGFQSKEYRLEYEDHPQAVDPARREPGTPFLFKVVQNGVELFRH
ncbi:eCIS core domain-containing protein [Sorangium sp. So ce1078]|uniref:eCIS core domain-containing protein n=1 Tax=Sorangium sp. So ce1078 TaxID=3133329 RepID=UPI003F627A08